MTKKSSHCPFYGVDEDICDVGCGYISPSDVSRIVTLCFGCHTACNKYGELLDRNNVSRRGHFSPPAAANEKTRHHADTGFTRHSMLGFGSVTLAIGLMLLNVAPPFWPWLLLLGLGAATTLTIQGFRGRSGNLALVAALQVPAAIFFLTIISLLALPRYNLLSPPSPTAAIVFCILWIIYAILAHSYLQRTGVPAYGLPATIILCALGTLLFIINPASAPAIATGLGLTVVGGIYLATALADNVVALRPASRVLLKTRL